MVSMINKDYFKYLIKQNKKYLILIYVIGIIIPFLLINKFDYAPLNDENITRFAQIIPLAYGFMLSFIVPIYLFSFLQKNPEAFAPGFFFTLCNTRNLPCPTLSGNRAKSIKKQGNGHGPRSGLGKERRDILYIRSFPPHSSHQKVASCPVAWASSRKRRRLSSASVFSILCMANPAWIMI